MILNTKNNSDDNSVGVEFVKQQQSEFKIIGSVQRTKGLKLFEYDHMRDKLREVEIKFKDEIFIRRNSSGVVYADYDGALTHDAFINGNNDHFEALNFKTAQNRVDKFKQGKLKYLNNLKPVTKNKIPIYG